MTNPAELYQHVLVPAVFGPWAEELLCRAAPQPGARVLDVGCGTGVVTRAAARAVGPRGTVTGLDMNPAMLEVARHIPVDEGGAHHLGAGACRSDRPAGRDIRSDHLPAGAPVRARPRGRAP